MKRRGSTLGLYRSSLAASPYLGVTRLAGAFDARPARSKDGSYTISRPALNCTGRSGLLSPDANESPSATMKRFVDHHLRLGELAPIGQLDRHRDAGLGTIERVGHARDGELVRAGHALALGFASGLARLPAPSALAVRAAKLLGRDPDRDRVRLGQNVIFFAVPQEYLRSQSAE